ncbi:uncharacterized protein N7483_013212 [Penicillium malachiteum]|uniref:uncharacterized protein n=1 Tax=Penicillium malachiteum TaxID=1324776 RepID=UPI0025472227|nr:uncharacterized protein N7483_013212 [Penicillium malachiteum]KAJ5716031.1 hypothetical protein N7483_013212 [Penicillium malachiteum]
MASLPSDCWLIILKHLEREDYRSLLLASKSTHPFVESFLFREIAWEWRPIPFRKILLLFRAILQKPERASHIQHLSLLSHQSVSTMDEWELPICEVDPNEELLGFQDVLRQAQTIVKTAHFPDAETWIGTLESGNPYSFVFILLSQLLNLQSLRLDYSFVWQSGLPGLMLQHALSSSSSPLLSKFRLLRDVDYGGNIRRDKLSDGPDVIDDEPGYPQCNPQQFPAWFYLLSLRSLTIWLRTKQGVELPDGPPNLSRLQSLILARATIQETKIPEILSLAPHLETLHLGMAYRWGEERALSNGPFIVQGLDSIRESVTNLSIGIEWFPPTTCDVLLHEGEEELTRPFDGLITRFPKVRSVEITANLLVVCSTDPSTDLTSVLSDQVEQLCLRMDYETVYWDDWGKRILDLVTNNAPKLRSHMPGLRRVCVRGWSRVWSNPRTSQRIDLTRAACAQEGIHFEVISDQLSNGIWTETRICPERRIR